MQRQETSSFADAGEMMLPQLPPMEGALPIDDADSALEQASMPRPRARERHYRSRSSLAMEVLSRRMSRQTLLQQHQSRPTSTDNAALDSSLDEMTMEMDLDDASPSMPVPPSAQRQRPSRRFLSLSLPHVSPIAPETTIDPEVASRVLARMQADAQPAIRPAQSSRSSNLVPAIEIDAAEQADDAQADEGYSEGPDEYPWLGEKLAGTLRSQGLLSFTTSAEAAMRCPKLVRNVPRMRKRSHKKKEHRLRTSREPTGEPSQLQTPAGNAMAAVEAAAAAARASMQ
ncbi:hypothetical protein TGAM01_v208619 [Trichoderma gamsii]|uniref:Uncharacterized protein n=1 Tax=Trichoderma gamsii TaxID=398673 RepID=A0A2P4ZE05_9HYPO|nr:hypothetical protein TGAM01_v208619 [Trichoderma gamsii]PON22535.1 hypothetical protein TGAM01_v208619 [Trichoderma gamsii]